MSLPIEAIPYTEEWIPAVRRFNGRLIAAGLEPALGFPESHISEFPKGTGADIWQEYYLIAEANEVRGAFILTHEEWSFYGETHSVAHLRLPISEGIADRKYREVSQFIFETALGLESRLYAMGLGSFQNPYLRRLRKMNWHIYTVPFRFRMRHTGPCLRNLAVFRSGRTRRLAALLARTGLGALGIHAAQTALRMAGTRRDAGTAEVAGEFDSWAGDIWERSRAAYALIGPRDERTLNIRYPPGHQHYIRLRVRDGAETVGWAVLLDSQLQGNKHFGDLRIGVLVDALALPGREYTVVREATRFLAQRGVDLLFSNQSHRNWYTALEHCGYLPGPTNYYFVASPELAALMPPVPEKKVEFHITRGDGPGPDRLMPCKHPSICTETRP